MASSPNQAHNPMSLIEINPDNPQPRLIEKAASLLRQGGIICYPTDTQYGLGCDIYNQKAVNRVFQIKKRPKHKPFSFMCSSLKDVSTYCHLGNTAYKIMRKHLPGPYTFILPAMKIVPKILITKQKTVGIRVPENAICMQLVEALGNPILTTSAAVPRKKRRRRLFYSKRPLVDRWTWSSTEVRFSRNLPPSFP